MSKRAFSLAELLLALTVVSMGLLAIAGAVIYSTRVGGQAARQTRALQYAKQIIALSKLYNLPRVAPINDLPASRVAVNAPPFQDYVSADPQYRRNLRMQVLATDPNDYRSQLYRIEVSVFWFDRGIERSLRDVSVHRAQ